MSGRYGGAQPNVLIDLAGSFGAGMQIAQQEQRNRLFMEQAQRDRADDDAFRAIAPRVAQRDPAAMMEAIALNPQRAGQMQSVLNGLDDQQWQRGQRILEATARAGQSLLDLPDAQWGGAWPGLRQQFGALGVQLPDAPPSRAQIESVVRASIPAATLWASRQQQERERIAPIGGTSAGPAPGGDASLPRGLRNNNPLNIEAGGFTQNRPGFAGSDGRFARFETQEQGIAAADELLQRYARMGLNTPAGIIGRWAPASDGNNVSSYAASVARALGVAPNAPIDMADPAARRRLIEAMAQVENGRPLAASAPAGQAPAQPAVAPTGQAPAQAVQATGAAPAAGPWPPPGYTALARNGVPVVQGTLHLMQGPNGREWIERPARPPATPPRYDTVTTADGVFRVNQQDARDVVRMGDRPRTGSPEGRLPAALVKLDEEDVGAIQSAAGMSSDLSRFRDMVGTAQLPLSGLGNAGRTVLNSLGMSTEASRNLASFQATLERLRNESLRLNKGVQTDQDATRAWNELLTNINDEGVVKQRLAEIEQINQRAIQLRLAAMNRRRQENGAQPIRIEDIGGVPQPAVGLGGQGQGQPAPGQQQQQQDRPTQPPPAGQQQAQRIADDTEYAALASGTEFIGPDGQRRRKP